MTRLWRLAVVAFIVLGIGAVYLNSVSDDGRSGHVSTLPDMSRLQPGDTIVDVIVPQTLSSRAEMGKRAFESACAACHGLNAAGVMGAGPTFISRIYVPNHHADYSFLSAVANGVTAHHWPFGNMPPQEGMTRADILNIIAYIRELQRANGIS
ncbi:MAG: c-type cytochrome [Paracoccaceae bacterium]